MIKGNLLPDNNITKNFFLIYTSIFIKYSISITLGGSMKKCILIVLMLSLLITACTRSNGNSTNTDNVNENIIDVEGKNGGDDEIDRSEYLTGEIITDGVYAYPSRGFGTIYFVPDEESSKIMKEKYNASEESILLLYNDVSIVESLPQESGIYKVKVSMELKEEYNWLMLKDIQLTDEIGTVLYEGKNYETNELDENVKVKDKVCGLIVKWISRDDVGGIQIRFAGEIESEGYYFINYDLMYDDNVGKIYFDEENFNNIPFYGERGHNNFYFIKTNDLFDELQDFSSFGKGKFKTTNYQLIYNIGMGRDPSDYLSEIISLDEAYKNMFVFDKNKYVGRADTGEGFIIVTSSDYDENQNYISTDYYYVNNNNPEKLFLFSSGGYNYNLKIVINENEFVMSTDGYNYITEENDSSHIIIFKIAEDGVKTKVVEDLGIESDKIDDDGSSYNMQGNISDIKISENSVIITLTGIKMKKEDELAFGKSLNASDSIDILIADNNKSGPLICIGDKIMINCKYTIDKEFLYSFGAEIGIRNLN